MKAPSTLQEAIIYFADADNCLGYMVAHRWPDGRRLALLADAPMLAGFRSSANGSARAPTPSASFPLRSAPSSRIPLGLEKWLPAVWLIAGAKNGISSCEIARALGVTQKTAWFMLHRIRLAMQRGSLIKLGGGGAEVEADETFIGGKARNMHTATSSLADHRHAVARTRPWPSECLERGGQGSHV